ncbi:MAG: glycosyltransferase family 4 protein [Pseudomonadota bacterium]
MPGLKLFIHDYAGHPFQVELSRELARRGHEVTHAYFGGDAGPKGVMKRLEGDAESLSFLPIDIEGDYTKTSFVKRRFQDVAYGRAAADAIKAARPDVVLSGNTPTESQALVMKGAHASGARFVHWCQDFYSIAVTKILSQKLPGVGAAVSAYYRMVERKQFAGADGVVLITEDFAPQAKAWGVTSDRLHVIPNWGAIDEIPLRPKDNDWAKAQGLDGKSVFLYSGTLGLKHNPDLLIGLARALRDDPNARVVVVSAGSGVEALEAAKAQEDLDNLVLLPLQPFEALPDVLATADVLMAVIERDAGLFSVPSKILSYLCAGMPILLAAPEENLAAKTVKAAECGLVVEPESEADWLAAAQRLAEDPALRESMGAKGRAHAEANFDISIVADRFEAVFDAALAETALCA